MGPLFLRGEANILPTALTRGVPIEDGSKPSPQTKAPRSGFAGLLFGLPEETLVGQGLLDFASGLLELVDSCVAGE